MSCLIMLEPQNMNTSWPSLKEENVCVVIAVDPTLGCGPPEVRPLLGDVFFLHFTILWVVFPSHPSCDTTVISARPAAVRSHPVHFSLLQITCSCLLYHMKGSLEVPQSHLKVVFYPLQHYTMGLPASLSFTFSPHLFGITLITLLTIGAELFDSRNSSIAGMLTFLMIMRLQIALYCMFHCLDLTPLPFWLPHPCVNTASHEPWTRCIHSVCKENCGLLAHVEMCLDSNLL